MIEALFALAVPLGVIIVCAVWRGIASHKESKAFDAEIAELTKLDEEWRAEPVAAVHASSLAVLLPQMRRGPVSRMRKHAA